MKMLSLRMSKMNTRPFRLHRDACLIFSANTQVQKCIWVLIDCCSCNMKQWLPSYLISSMPTWPCLSHGSCCMRNDMKSVPLRNVGSHWRSASSNHPAEPGWMMSLYAKNQIVLQYKSLLNITTTCSTQQTQLIVNTNPLIGCKLQQLLIFSNA